MPLALSLIFAMIAIFALVVPAPAQCSGRWLPGEGLPGVNGAVYAIVSLANGDLVVGGSFSTAGTVAAANIARWSVATSRWSPIGAGLDAPVFAAAMLSGGDIIVGGQFSSSGSVPLAGVARLNPGTGTWTSLGVGVSGGEVDAIAVGPGGDAFVVGVFTAAGGIPVSGIARWTPATGQWSSLGAGTNRGLRTLAVHPSGDVYVGGTFGPGSFNANGIARWSATTHTWSALGAGLLGGNVSAIAILSSGNVLAGGNFTLAGSTTVSGAAMWNPTTNTWTALGSGVTGGSRTINALLPLMGGDFLAGGDFATAGSVSAPNIARWNASSASWSAVGTPGAGLSGPATTLVPISSGPFAGQVAVGGGFSTVGGPAPASLAVGNIARLAPSSAVWSALGSGVNGLVNALAVVPGGAPGGNGEVFVGGSFVRAGTIAAANVARWNPASDSWAPLGAGVNGIVNALAATPNGDAVVAGQFTAVYSSSGTSIPADRIARWSAATNTWSALGTGIGGPPSGIRVLAVAALPSGDIVAGGGFTTAGGAPAAGVAVWNASSGTWSPMGSGVDGLVYALAALPGGDVIAGGNFTTAGDVPASGIARWSAASHNWSPLGAGVNSTVYALAVVQASNGTQVIVAGDFTSAGDIPANSISAWNADTGAWAVLGAFAGGVDSPVLCIAPVRATHSGDLIVGGGFDAASGALTHRIARWNASTHAWTSLGAGGGGANTSVYAVAALLRGDVLAGGTFTSAGGEVSSYFARWSTRPACPGDFNCSGQTDIGDLFAYLNAFLSGDPAADFNGVGGVDLRDVLEFVSAWFGGC